MSLYDQYNRLTVASVLEMLGEFESRQLDCKLVGKKCELTRDDRKNLAVSLSGFANAEGGIILWGVSARKREEDGIDCIDAHPGVDAPQMLLSRLQEATGQAVSPGIVGVDHRMLLNGENGPHFVATYVPQCDGGPYMARLGEDRYYQRIGSSFLRMEHFQIADMFGRRARPELKIEVMQSDSSVLDVVLRNVGRGVARAPYVMLKIRGPYIPAPYPQSGKTADFPLPLLPATSIPGWGAFVGNMNTVLHPGVSLRFRAITVPTHFTGQTPTQCTAEYKIGAVGALERGGEFTFDFERGRIERSGDGYFSDSETVAGQ